MEEGTGGKPPDTARPGVDAVGTAPEPVLYSNEHKFNWYKVIIQVKPASLSISSDTTRKPYLRAIAVSKVLGEVTNYSKDITEVRRLTRTKFLIICSTAGCANRIVQSEKVKSLYAAFIPQVYLTRAAILRDVDVEVDGEPITDEEIFNHLDCGNFKLLKVQRLNRKVMIESKATYVPSTSVKLVFDGQDMPTHVYLWYTRLQCEPFVQNPVQCFTCFKFGHVTKYCSTKTSLCRKCYQIETEGHECDLLNLKCLNCHGPHNVNSKNCPEFERQKNIKLLMSTRNMCFPEAADLVPSSKRSFAFQTKNSFAVLDTDVSADFSDFPEIKRKTPNAQGRRDFVKYVPPPLPQTVKRKPSGFNFSAPSSGNQAPKKNKTDPPLFEKMRNMTKPQQFHSDKEISNMFYRHAMNNKTDKQVGNVVSFAGVSSQGSQSSTFRSLPGNQSVNTKNISSNVSQTSNQMEDVHMSDQPDNNVVNNTKPKLLGTYSNVLSPDLS
ncbi:hypothetical protein M8J75_006073 [Diaphorina citri]|nr:hypothetical protein M8J75_009164 [Diaphorina citri]KAI5701101.1 hypothetical protein M8J75_006073 [Diaphorina citri]